MEPRWGHATALSVEGILRATIVEKCGLTFAEPHLERHRPESMDTDDQLLFRKYRVGASIVIPQETIDDYTKPLWQLSLIMLWFSLLFLVCRYSMTEWHHIIVPRLRHLGSPISAVVGWNVRVTIWWNEAPSCDLERRLNSSRTRNAWRCYHIPLLLSVTTKTWREI